MIKTQAGTTIRKVSLVTRRWELRARREQTARLSPAYPPRTPAEASCPTGGTRGRIPVPPSLADHPWSTTITLPLESEAVKQLQRFASVPINHTNLAAQLVWEDSVLHIRLTLEPPRRRLIDATQVAEILGVSRSSVYRLAARRELPAYHLGRLLRFDAAEVLRYLASLHDFPGGE